MAETIRVAEVVTEKTHVGRVTFPVAVPERLVDLLEFPNDLCERAAALGLDRATVDFVLAVLSGRWGLSATLNLQALAIKTGWKYTDMDRIVRGLLEKNYARLNDRLDLYRLWIVVLHVKGIRFVAAD